MKNTQIRILITGAVIAFLVMALIAIVAVTSIALPHATRRVSAKANDSQPQSNFSNQTLEERYLALMKRFLTRSNFGPSFRPVDMEKSAMRRFLARHLASRDLVLTRVVTETVSDQEEGRSTWPVSAETMIGMKRLDNLEVCIRDVLTHHVPGDLIECGAWRGGATIFMRAVLQVYGDTERTVWVADSFEGLPKPDESKYPADKGIDLWSHPELAVSVEEVKANFERYGLLDRQVSFLKGWFKDTLPTAPIKKLAILRVDGDLYESTWEALTYLYPKLSVGGYCIVDDYGAIPACARAVEDFRKANKITSEVKKIDWTGVYWQRTQ